MEPKTMATIKTRTPKLSAFAQMLRDKREKLAPDTPLRDFCAKRGFETPMIADMEADRRTAPGTYAALYKLASGYGHQPDDRWTKQLLDAAVGKAPPPAPKRAAANGRRAASSGSTRPRGATRPKEPARRPPARATRSSRRS
jgi:hypothetical protein